MSFKYITTGDSDFVEEQNVGERRKKHLPAWLLIVMVHTFLVFF